MADNSDMVVTEEKQREWLKDTVWGDSVTPLLYDCAYLLCRWKLPEWREYLSAQQADGTSIEQLFRVDVITGGLTNKLYKCFLVPPANNAEKDADIPLPEVSTVLLRIYGTGVEELFDKEKEILRAFELGEARIGPKVYSTFETGRLEQWLEGRAASRKQLGIKHICVQIAHQLARFHKFTSNTQDNNGLQEQPILLKNLEKWTAESKLIRPRFRFESEHEMWSRIQTIDLDSKVAFLREQIEKLDPPSPIVFCHNDLQGGNTFLCENGEVALIDFEYSEKNYRGFDFANHFLEYAIDYTDPKHAPFFSIKEEDYPSEETQKTFFRAYLRGLSGEDDGITAPLSPKLNKRASLEHFEDSNAEQQLKNMIHEADIFVGASHLQWAIWGIVQSGISQIENFAFLEYAWVRLELFRKWRENLLQNLQAN